MYATKESMLAEMIGSGSLKVTLMIWGVEFRAESISIERHPDFGRRMFRVLVSGNDIYFPAIKSGEISIGGRFMLRVSCEDGRTLDWINSEIVKAKPQN